MLMFCICYKFHLKSSSLSCCEHSLVAKTVNDSENENSNRFKMSYIHNSSHGYIHKNYNIVIYKNIN